MKKGFWGKPRKQTVCLSRQVVLSGKRKEDKEAMKGKFTGVGVGPGDPQLLTLKALHAIQESDVVAIPVSDRVKTQIQNICSSVRLIRSSDKFIRRSGKKR